MIQEEIERREFIEKRTAQKTKAIVDTLNILKWFTATEREAMLEVIKNELDAK